MISQSQNPYIEHFTTSNGLPTNTVYRIFQDSRKFIWMATDAGVARYDGTNFLYFTTKEGLNTNEIIHIQEDSRGRIWMFNFNGSFNFYFKGKIFNGKNASYLDSLQSPYLFRKMYEDEKGTLYFYDNFYTDLIILTNDSRVLKVKIPNYLPVYEKDINPANINLKYLTRLKNEFYYFSTSGLFKTKDLSQIPATINKSFFTGRVFSLNESELVADVYQKKTRKLFLLRFNDFKIIDTLATPNRTSKELINDVIQDIDDNFWISMDSRFYYLKGNEIQFQIDGANFQNILQDHEKNIWVGSLGNGAYKINLSILQQLHFSSDRFNFKGIKCVNISNQGGLWVSDGFNIYLLKNNKVLNLQTTFQKGNIMQIEELINNSLIIGQPNNNIKVIKSKLQKEVLTINQFFETSNNPIKFFSVNSKKDKVVAFYSNLILELHQDHLDKENKIFHFSEERLYNIWHNPEDQVFVNGKKLYLFQEGKLTPFKPLEKIYGKIIKQHLNLSRQLELFNVDGNQLYLFNGHKLFNLSNVFDPIIDQPIKYLTYKDPYLFIATNTQIYFCNISSGNSFTSKVKLNNLDIAFNNIHHLLVHNNELIISSDDGLSFMPIKTMISSVSQPPIPYFRNILVNEKPATIKDAQIVFKGNSKLQFTLGNIRYNASQVHYAFKLVGWDNTWNTVTEPTVIYQNLKPGIYTFILKAKLSSSSWSEEIKHTVRVKPTLFQHPLFFVLSSISIMVLLFMFLNNYQKALIKRKEREHQIVVLEQKALHLMMNPHFIFNVLGSIQSYILKNNNIDAGLYLSKFSRLIRQTLKATKMSTIELEEEVGRLKNYLALEQLRMEHRFNFTISVDNSIDDEALIPSMILQPIVENAIWHGLSNIDSDGLIVIQFIQLEENIVKIIIEDNGIGIKKASSQPNQKPAHLKIGSELTRKRLAILGKKMNVKTNISISEAFPGNPRPGTRVEIVAPISYKIIEIE